MKRWILLLCLAALSLGGCASEGYQPGLHGVRDLPSANYYAPNYGMVNNSDCPNSAQMP